MRSFSFTARLDSMIWRPKGWAVLPRLAALVVLLVFALGSRRPGVDPPPGLSLDELRVLRDEARDMFRHGYDSYLFHAGQKDELRPLSCDGRGHVHRTRGTLDDSLGGYRLTLIDSLDMLALHRNFTAFYAAIEEVRSTVRFDRDVFVSVFEANIRVLGGLLAAHQLASRFQALLPTGWYDGFLLHKALDLGQRLLPAFETPTGLPYHRINLKTGRIAPREKKQTCTAAAGSLLVEMGLLSRLSGDMRFELAARRAVDALWEGRSELNLVGSIIDINTGRWTAHHTGVGAGVDSFHEYLYKAHVLLKNSTLGAAFNESYTAVQRHCLWKPTQSMHRNFQKAARRNRSADAWYMHLGDHESAHFLIEVDMHRGQRSPHGSIVSSLQAFWPGLQVLAGHASDAEDGYAHLLALWGRYRALPELFDVSAHNGAGSLLRHGRDSPLRPELIESTFHLFEATRKSTYLLAAKEMLHAIQNSSKVECGYAAIADVASGRLDDRMDSFVLSETFKYLFLTFDSSLPPAERSSLICADEQESQSRRRAATPHQGNSTRMPPITAAVGVDGSGRLDDLGVRADCLRKEEFIFSTEGHILLIP